MKIESSQARPISSGEVIYNSLSVTDKPFEQLPDELIRYIFSFVGIKYVGVMPLVCKRWKILYNQDRTWAVFLSISENEPCVSQILIKKYRNISRQLLDIRTQLIDSIVILKEFKQQNSQFVVPMLGDNIFIDDNKLIFANSLNDSEIRVFDLEKHNIVDLKECDETCFSVSQGIIYYINEVERKLVAYNFRANEQLWEYQFTHSEPTSIFVNKRKKRLYVVGTLFHAQSRKENLSFHVFDLSRGNLISKKVIQRDNLRFLTCCGSHAYFIIEEDNDSDNIAYVTVNLDISDPKFFTLFEKHQMDDMMHVIGTVEDDLHIVCSRIMLAVLKLSFQKSEFIFTHTLSQDLAYVSRLPDTPVYALLENILCIHVYDSSRNQYLLQFWDMSSYVMLRQLKVPFKLGNIFYSGKKLIAISCEQKLFTLEFTTMPVDELSERFQLCSIM